MTWNLAKSIVQSAPLSNDNLRYSETKKVLKQIPLCEQLLNEIITNKPTSLEIDCILDVVDKQIYDNVEETIEKLFRVFFSFKLSTKSEKIILNKLLSLCGSADNLLLWINKDNISKSLTLTLFACENKAKGDTILSMCLDGIGSSDPIDRKKGCLLIGMMAANDTEHTDSLTLLKLLLSIFLVEAEQCALVSFWGLAQSMLSSGDDSVEVINIMITAMNLEPLMANQPISLMSLLELITHAKTSEDIGMDAVAFLITHRAWVNSRLQAQLYDEERAWDSFCDYCRKGSLEVQRILAGILAGAATSEYGDLGTLKSLVRCVSRDVRSASLRALKVNIGFDGSTTIDSSNNKNIQAYNCLKQVVDEGEGEIDDLKGTE